MTAIRKVKVHVGADGLARYTAIYGNGEKGPMSEGYGRTPADSNQPEAEQIERNIEAAVEAARRDFPDLPVETDDD